MNPHSLSAVGTAMAGIMLALATGPAAADHGSEYSNRIARKPAAAQAPGTAGLASKELIARQGAADDQRPLDADARNERSSTAGAQAAPLGDAAGGPRL